MTITTNIPKVLGQLEHLRADFPRAIARALQPAKWIGRAREVAEAVLKGMASAEEARFVPAFVQAVRTGVLEGGGGLSMMLDARRPGRSLFAVQESLPGVEAGTRLVMLANASRVGLLDLLQQWVAADESAGGKRRDERDAGRTDEQIVEHLWAVLFSPDDNSGLDEARAGLIPHLSAFYAKQFDGSALAPETVDLWLRAVLAAWRVMVLEEITQRIRAELKGRKFP